MNVTITEYSPTAAALAELRTKFAGVVYDVSTGKGMTEAKAARMELRSLRTGLEAKRKEIKAPALERCRAIDDEAKRITAEIVALEDPIDEQIRKEEARKEAERAAKVEAERRRVSIIQSAIAGFRVVPFTENSDPAVISRRIAELGAVDLSEGFDEFAGEAAKARDEAIVTLRDVLAKAEEIARKRAEEAAAMEAERQRIAAERAELERQQSEARKAQEEADRAAAAARAEADRIAAEQRAQAEAEHRARMEAEQAALRAEREAEAKRRAEAEAQERAERERIAEERRIAEVERLRHEIASATLVSAAQDALAYLGGIGHADSVAALKLDSALRRHSEPVKEAA